MHSHNVVLDVATSVDAGVLANLLELYIHEMSDAFPHLVIGADGRFGYRRLPLYWAEPENRFAFLIRCDARLAGFALVTRGSPITDDPSVLDLAEFFVLRSYRRSQRGSSSGCTVVDASAGQVARSRFLGEDWRRGVLEGRDHGVHRGHRSGVGARRRRASVARVLVRERCSTQRTPTSVALKLSRSVVGTRKSEGMR